MSANSSPQTMMGQGMQWYQLSINSDTAHILSAAPALSPSHRAVAYGDGFFTTMGVQAGQILWQSYHQRRITHHATALCMSLDSTRLAALWRQIDTYAQQIAHGIIKVMLTRRTQAIRGYGFATDAMSNQVDIWVGVLQKQPVSTAASLDLSHFTSLSLSPAITSTEPITALTLSAQIGCLPHNLVGLKTLNRLDNVMAAAELEQKKTALTAIEAAKKQPKFAVTEGLVQDVSGQWVEGTMSNVFYQLNNNIDNQAQWYTPPIDRSGVNGIMRQVIIDQLKVTATPVIERRLNDTDLPKLSAMFFCNAVRGVMPVGELILANQQRVDLQWVQA